jgi:hypothetical protein
VTWTYTNPGASTLDAVRYYLQDTDVSDPLVSDEEINFLIDQWYARGNNSAVYVAAIAADNLAGKFAREVSVSADGVSVGVQELQDKFMHLAESLRAQYSREQLAGGPETFGNNFGEEFEPDIKPLTFGKGMHDNLDAGRQDYGGSRIPDTSPEYGY